MNEIKFYREGDDYGYFSNFYFSPIQLKGKIWRTSEHYFQAQKFAGTRHEREIRKAVSPSKAARLGRSRSKPLRKDWERIKDNVMRTCLYAKFTQHEDLKQKLLDTGDAILIEHTHNDSYWADGGVGSGKNMLGKLLMELREKLRKS